MYQNFFSISVAPYRYIRNESGHGCEPGEKRKAIPSLIFKTREEWLLFCHVATVR